MIEMKKLQDVLNDWLKENQTDIDYKFKEYNLFDEDSIKQMKLIYYYINKKDEINEKDTELKEMISEHIVKSWKIKGDKEREKSGKELIKSGKKTKILKYEITPEMLEYKGYNKTKFKNIEGLYGLMQMN